MSAFSNELPSQSLPARIVTARQELLNSGWTEKGTVQCKKCNETVFRLQSASGSSAYFDDDGRMHNFTCGDRDPSYPMPPPPDQEAYLKTLSDENSSSDPKSRDTSG